MRKILKNVKHNLNIKKMNNISIIFFGNIINKIFLFIYKNINKIKEKKKEFLNKKQI